MNKKAIWGIVVVIVIIVIAIFAFSDGAEAPSGELTGDTTESFTGTLQELLARGGNITCTFSANQEGGSISGTVYVAGERVRGDYTFTQDGNEFETSTIVDPEWLYAWGDTPLGTTATKMRVQEEGNTVEPEAETESAVPGADQDLEYSCSRWSVDSSMFDPPSGIEFQDITLGKGAPNLGNAPDVDCSVCDQMPAGEARDQCLQALGC